MLVCIRFGLDLLHASDCARNSKQISSCFHSVSMRLRVVESTHREGRNQDFLCGLWNNTVYTVHTTHSIQIHDAKRNSAAIYCCHQTTNFFTQYALACYFPVIVLLSRAAAADTSTAVDNGRYVATLRSK